MPDQPAYLRVAFDPIADPAAVVIEGRARFTLLTSRLIRMEYSPDGRFEDRPSQPFWYRRQSVPDFTVERADGEVVITTDYLELTYRDGDIGFQPDTLSILLREPGTCWHYDDLDEVNLLGTTRTLDTVSGSVQLEPGLLSRSGWAVVDDSATLVFDHTNWLATREAAEGTQDIYFFGYGQDYRGCLSDFARVAGKTPLLPRWALGNWWSRYWRYSAADLQSLMQDFRSHEVPLSVCIIDMDWHLVDVGPGVNGWTGYTWNRDLFPDPQNFITWLHQQGLRTALNLHPALGVRAHEAGYPEMARRLGIDPKTAQTLAFDIADPEFAQAYFEVLHHPQEADGIDFWWLDWQQGQNTSLAGLDPLWWLNHLHYYDRGRTGKRPFTFSRWGGLGNHRYPIGFSGDTHVTWESLAFQPYFTATAANVGYGWWSHDIGGHMHGIEDRELFTRWVQYGVFSPIFRLHSTNNPYHDRRPWGYDNEVFHITRDAMQLRHALIPYLYTCSWLNETTDVAPVRPLYHDYPDSEEAYVCPQAYFFGNDLIVAPYTSPADFDTRLSRQVVWLPPGDWYDFFTGQYYRGDAWYALYGRLGDIPVFARAGALVPLAPRVGWGGVDVGDGLDIYCFAGAGGRFSLFEDSGETLAYREGAFALTDMVQTWSDNQVLITIHAPGGDTQWAPGQRRVRIHLMGVSKNISVTAQLGDELIEVTTDYDEHLERLTLAEIELPRGLELKIVAQGSSAGGSLSRRDRLLETGLQLVENFRMESHAKVTLARQLDGLRDNPALLHALVLAMTPSQVEAVLETMTGAGAHLVSWVQPPQVVLWNNHDNPIVRYDYSALNTAKWLPEARFRGESEVVPHFRLLMPESKAWRMAVLYGGVLAYQLRGEG